MAPNFRSAARLDKRIGKARKHCSTCGKNPKRSSSYPTRPRQYRPRRSWRGMRASVKVWIPPPEWVCETCGKIRYGERKFAKRSAKDLAIARGAIVEKLRYEEERAKGLEEKILCAIGDFLQDLWGDPAPWMYEDEDEDEDEKD